MSIEAGAIALGGPELMRIHIETLYTHDANGRMVRVNEPNGAAAPRVFLGRTGEGTVCRFRHDLDDALVRQLESVWRAEPAGEEFLTAPYDATAYEEVLGRTSPIHRKWAGPAFRFPTELRAPESTVLVTEENSQVLVPHLSAWVGDVATGQPLLAYLVDGCAVSACCSVRTTPVADEAGVETALAFRGRGYAVHPVTEWARAVRAAGRIPLYSTSWENSASRAVARKLGLVRFGADLHIT